MTKHNDRPYYLYGSSIITGDDTSVGQSDNTMVNGPFTSKGITTSILKTKVSINSFDLNDNTRDSFTLGLNDPIKWKINVKTLLSSLYSNVSKTICNFWFPNFNLEIQFVTRRLLSVFLTFIIADFKVSRSSCIANIFLFKFCILSPLVNTF